MSALHQSIAALATELGKVMPTRYLQNSALLEVLAARWCERHRFWHTPTHLRAMVSAFAAKPPGAERDTLLLAALYHDAIYDSRETANEEKSAQLLLDHAADRNDEVIRDAAAIIRASVWSERPATRLIGEFFEQDTIQLSPTYRLSGRLAYETAIFREYQWADFGMYQTKRREFLEAWVERFPEQRAAVAECIDLLTGFAPRLAVYPGSFNPFHAGHLSILRQAETMFDKVIIAVGINRQKPGAAESAEARFAALQHRLRFHQVQLFDGLLTDYLESLSTLATLVRGVRDGTDLEAELRYSRFLNELRPATNIAWISCEAELQHLSSSAIRELESISPGAGARYVPDTNAIYALVAEGGAPA